MSGGAGTCETITNDLMSVLQIPCPGCEGEKWVPEKEEKENGTENIIKEIMTEIFSNVAFVLRLKGHC